MNFLSQTFRKDASRSLLALIAALAIVCPLSVLLIIVPLWLNRQGQMSDTLLYASLITWLAVLVVGSLAAARFVVWRRNRRLDAIFAPLEGRPYLVSWREYRGMLDGRAVTARFTRGPTLEIAVQTGVMTRFGIAAADQPGLALAGAQKPLELHAPWLQQWRVYPLDPAWTTALLESPAAAEPLARLMQAGASWALVRQVTLRPGALKLILYRSKNLFSYPFSAEDVRGWIADLGALAGLAESLPRPIVEAQESHVEQAERTGTVTRNLVVFVVGFFLLIGIWMGFLLWLVSVLDK